jgi:Phosphotransferase enzyme family
MTGRQPRYRAIAWIPTNAGRSVCIAETASGGRVVVKRAQTAVWAADLAEQARHFRVMSALLGADSPYPPVLEAAPGRLVLPYYEHGSLDDITAHASQAHTRILLNDALSLLLRIGEVRPPGHQPPPPQVARTFLVCSARTRLARLDAALATPAGREWGQHRIPGSGLPRGALLEEHTAWLRDPAVLDSITRIGPGRLALAAHGDFGLSNVLLATPPRPGARLVFIDVRGLWHHGYPWWDPVMDLAILSAFSCQIRPALARAGELPAEAGTVPGRPGPGQVAGLAQASPDFTAWARDDPYWRQRLDIAVAIRLLGNISVQLGTAPRNPGLRAAVVLGLYIGQVQRISGLIRSLRSGGTPGTTKGRHKWTRPHQTAS